jgi:anoctamin-10
MCSVQAWFGALNSPTGIIATVRGMFTSADAASFSATGKPQARFWDVDSSHARAKLHPGRLTDQMFAYTVTGQVTDAFSEIGLPFLLRRLDAFRKGKTTIKDLVSLHSDHTSVKKRVVFEDEQEKGGIEERAFLDSVREEAALPEYDLFVDYSEMVVQFGYVVLWSTIWPLAGGKPLISLVCLFFFLNLRAHPIVMAFINNIFEMRSDAFKIAVHNRRAIPSRTDTIGPWLDVLTFLTWLGALTNSALVYLFSPQLISDHTYVDVNNINKLSPFPSETLNITGPSLPISEHLTGASSTLSNVNVVVDGSITPSSMLSPTHGLLLKAILVSLVASHGFLLVRVLIRHIVQKVFWSGSSEVKEREREERNVKAQFLSGSGVEGGSKVIVMSGGRDEPMDKDSMGFWDHDEGLDEIQRISKEA